LQSDMRPEAERTAKINFLLEKIVEEKGIEVTDEEMNKQIEEAAKGMGVDPEQAKQNLAGIMDRLEFSVKMDKAVQYLIDHAQIEEFETETNEEEDETSGDD
jgi:trigger factor